jgi:hypothetical protein
MSTICLTLYPPFRRFEQNFNILKTVKQNTQHTTQNTKTRIYVDSKKLAKAQTREKTELFAPTGCCLCMSTSLLDNQNGSNF